MILRILISLSIIVLTQCNKTTPEKSKLPIDADSSITEIIDYIPELPFEIVYKPIAKLPDSLAGREIRGKKYVNVLLDSTCGIEQLNILYLLLKNKAGNKIIESRLNESEHNKNVQRFENWANKYMHEIIFRRKKGTEYIKLWFVISVPFNEENTYQ